MKVELTTLDLFREYHNAIKSGFIINDDKIEPRIHKAGCSSVKEAHFIEKVIENTNSFGRYFYVSSKVEFEPNWKQYPPCKTKYCFDNLYVY